MQYRALMGKAAAGTGREAGKGSTNLSIDVAIDDIDLLLASNFLVPAFEGEGRKE